MDYSLDEFPTEILRHIFLCFERDDWKNVLQVCKNWYSLGTRVFVEVLIYKGTRLLQMKNYKRSLKYFDQVLHVVDLVSKREASPEDYKDKELILSEEFVTKKCRVLNNKAVALMNLKKHDDAINCLKDVLKMKPDHVKAMNNLGDNLNSLQRYEEAIEVFDKALEYDPNRLSVLYNKGNSYLHMKRFHEAIEWYDRAIVVQPKDVDSLGNKAIALYRLGCLNEAVKYFDEVLQYNSKDRIALRYKDFVSEELRKKQLQEVIVDLNSITSERKKEADLQKRPTPFTLGVLGVSQVGKTTLAIRMSTGNQAGNDQPNQIAPNQYRNTLEIDGEWYHVDVIDIASPESSSEKQFAENVKKADGFLICYSITDKDTLESVSNLHKLVKKIKKDDAQFLLIGNKVDAKGDREVLYETGKTIAEELKMEFVEASAKVPINVKFAETTLLKKMIKQRETLSAKQQAQQQVKRKDQPMTPTTEKRVKKVPCNIS